MIFKSIKTSDKSHLDFVQKLYIESFPPQERRPVLEFNKLINDEEIFDVYLILSNEERVGFISYWTFETFIYIEHFAISPEFRSAGFGKKVIEQFATQSSLPLVLEVELDTTDLAKRRIEFYTRSGFVKWNIPYQQPPYEVQYSPIPMYLMTYGSIDLSADFEKVKSALYSKVCNLL